MKLFEFTITTTPNVPYLSIEFKRPYVSDLERSCVSRRLFCVRLGRFGQLALAHVVSRNTKHLAATGKSCMKWYSFPGYIFKRWYFLVEFKKMTNILGQIKSSIAVYSALLITCESAFSLIFFWVGTKKDCNGFICFFFLNICILNYKRRSISMRFLIGVFAL